ncbi:MAG: HupE/UreJ family protein [Pseudomonadota bacterium]|nr:HupE/UreJ family protein [Pseudomonadota bacterium]
MPGRPGRCHARQPFPRDTEAPAVLAALALALVASPAWAHEPSEAAKQQMLDGGYLDFIWLGAEHMLTGYDHLLFLLAVLFFLKRPRDVVMFITAFTVGHTLTLLAGTFAGIRVNTYVIDAIIALTVVYKAFENLDGFRRGLGITPPPLLLMVFAFGLIHGLGLSMRLQEMTLVADSELAVKILTFNLGVEVGQIAALIVMGAVLSLWRGFTGWALFTRVVNGALMAAGAALFVMQVHGYLTTPAQTAQASASSSLRLHIPLASNSTAHGGLSHEY